jgi:dihydroneopterin aldolase
MNQDTVFVGFKNLEIPCTIGLLPDERTKKQILFLDLEVEVIKKAISDDPRQDLNYSELAMICKKIADEGEFFILESFAEKILDNIFCDDRVIHAEVSIKRPKAIKNAEYCYIKKSRKR